MALLYGGLTIPPAGTLNSVAAPRTLAAAGARALVPLTYGSDRVSALILNVILATTGSNTLLVQCVWGHACNAVGTLRLNDQALSGGSSVTSYTGSQVTAHAALVTAFAAQGITYGDTLAGYAYSVISMPVREFDGQLNFSAQIDGRKLYDPRKDTTAGGSGAHRLATPSTWEWSDNPALALGDWLYSSLYGAGETVLWSSVTTAANACDTLVGSPTEKRRLIGVSFTEAGPVPAVADALRSYAGCWLVPTSAGIKLLPDADAAAAASYLHASGHIAALDGLALKDMGSVPTVVDVVYTDTSQIPWRDATATAQQSGAGSTLPWRLSSVRLPGVQRYSQANREAIERLNKLTLNDLSTTLEIFDGGIAHEVGDIVNVTHPLGITAKPFRVTDVDMPGPGRWRLALIEHDPAVYSTLVATTSTYADTSRLSPAGPPGNVAGLAAEVATGGVRIYWTPATEVDYASTELRLGGASWAAGTFMFRGKASAYVWLGPAVGSYTVRAKHLDDSGQESTSSSSIAVTVTAGGAVIWGDISDRPLLYRVVARGTSDTQRPVEAALYDGESGSSLQAAATVFTVCKIERATGALTLVGQYNTGTGGVSATMATALDGLTGSGWIVVIFSYGNPAANRTATLQTAMFKHGASSAVFGSPDFRAAAAYVLVGVSNCGEGNGFESYNGAADNSTNAWCDASFYVQNGQLVMSGMAATPRTLADYSYTGALDATKNIVSYSASAPGSPVNGDVWVDTSTNPATTKIRVSGAWQIGANYSTNTNQLTDGAQLGLTAAWSGVSSRPTLYRVAARGTSDTARPIEAGLYNGETGATLQGPGTTYTVVKISRSTGALTVVGASSNGTTLGGYLDSISTSGWFVVVYSYGEAAAARNATFLTAMYKHGASRAVLGSPEFKTAGAYTLVGISNCGEGNAYEAYNGAVNSDTNAWVDVSFYTQAQQLVISGSAATPRTLADYSYTGALNATAGATWGSNITSQPADSVLLNSYVPTGVNLVYNSAFEAGLDGWTYGNNIITPTLGSGVNLNATWTLAPAGSPWTSVFFAGQGARNGTAGAYFQWASKEIPVRAGAKYVLSAYIQAHRATVEVFEYFYDDAGSIIGSPGLLMCQVTTNPQADAKTLDLFTRAYDAAVAPATAAYARLVMRKYDTNSGQSDSYMFVTRIQLEEVAADVTTPSAWSDTSVAQGSVVTSLIAAEAATEIYTALNAGPVSLANGGPVYAVADVVSSQAVGPYTANVRVVVTASSTFKCSSDGTQRNDGYLRVHYRPNPDSTASVASYLDSPKTKFRVADIGVNNAEATATVVTEYELPAGTDTLVVLSAEKTDHVSTYGVGEVNDSVLRIEVVKK